MDKPAERLLTEDDLSGLLPAAEALLDAAVRLPSPLTDRADLAATAAHVAAQVVFEAMAQRLVRLGVNPSEARRAALGKLLGAQLARERVIDRDAALDRIIADAIVAAWMSDDLEAASSPDLPIGHA